VIDPLHTAECDPRVAWSSGNVAEAFPGVSTPLSWTYFFEATETACRLAFFDMGIFTAGEATMRARVEERHMAIFYGRAASNVDTLRLVADRTPGVDADDLEQQVLGSVRPDAESHPTRRRYAVITARMPFAMTRAPRQIDRLRADTDRWWRWSIAAATAADADAAKQLLREASERHRVVMRAHTIVSMIAAGVFEQVSKAGAGIGKPELAARALAGFGSVEETDLASRMWEVAHGRAPLDAFVADYGFHGPVEGQLSTRTWREDRQPLETLLQSFASLSQAKSPLETNRREVARSAEARRQIAAELPASARFGVRLALALGARLIPRREAGKASYLQAADVARAAARRLGQLLTWSGALDDPEDAFFATTAELLGAPPADLRERVHFRRARYETYRELTLPATWTGVPTPVRRALVDDGAAGVVELRGLPASPGVVRGRARLVTDPGTAKLEPDEILVCETTDPSWAALFVIAAGAVIDIGSAISHGAIVARELGVPAVVNTGDATRRLRTGDLIELDGEAGVVRRLEPAPA
jgi:pyruvate,water dikinase